MTPKEKAMELVNQFRRITDEKGLRAIKLELSQKYTIFATK